LKLIWKQVIQAVALGTALPGMLFSAVANFEMDSSGKTEESKPETSQIQSTETARPVFIPVMKKNGNVVQMDLEDYISRVVLGEMPASFDVEALKSQAVAARTYTLRCVLGGDKHPEGAVCTDYRCCQEYREPEEYIRSGGSYASVEKVFDAVSQTAGQVLYYGDTLVMATYFASAGGTTEDAREVWGNSVPYLTVVSSPEGDDPYNGETITFSTDAFQSILGVSLKGKPESWFGRVSYTVGGGVDRMRIGGKLYDGVELRRIFGLRSTIFEVTTTETTITFETKGYGHRVGLSQYGADAMAELGSGYEQILSHYYPGTVIRQYDPDDD
jgi:stage II sporulation protein D